MTRFVDVYSPPEMPGWPCIATPRFSTDITMSDSGAERANRRWLEPLFKYQMPEAVRSMAIFNAVRTHFLVMGGPFNTWPWRDPLDFASVDLYAPNTEPVISAVDQLIGTGNGAATRFKLSKTYGRMGQTFTRAIRLPVVDSVLISVDGLDPGDLDEPLTWQVDRAGNVDFDNPVPPGLVVRSGFLFDVEVRFESDDSFDGIAKAWGVGAFADLTLIGTRGC